MTTDDHETPDPAAPPARKRRRGLRLLVGGLAALMLLALLAAGAALMLVGRPISAPDWLRETVETRLGEALPGLSVGFGDISVLVERDGMARVVLSDVDLRTSDGVPVATLADLRARLDSLPLLRGELQLGQVSLTGASMSLRRDREGRVGLALGDAFTPGTKAPDIPTIIAQIDAALSDSRLDSLRRVEAEALTIRYEDVRAGRGWTADGGRLSLTREDGTLRFAADVALLGAGDVAATLALNAESAIGSQSVEFGMNLSGLPAQDIATQSPALVWLGGLRAPISGALRGTLTETGDLGALNATLQIGAGVLQPNARTQPIPFGLARTYFSYDPVGQALSFDDITVQSALGTMISSGRAVLHGIESGWPDGMTGQFRVSRFEADAEGLFDTPFTLDGAELDWRLSFAPFRFELGRFRSTDPDLPLRLSGELSAETEGWRLALDGRLEEMDHETLLSYWPERLQEKPRKWVADNVEAGGIEHGIFSVRIEPGERPETYIDARLTGAELTYARNLPRLIGGEGQLTIYDHRLAVTVEAGKVIPPEGGEIDGAGTRFVIRDLREKPATGELTLSARGPLVAALSYIDSPKLEVMQKAGKPVALGDGNVEIGGTIVMPLMKGVKREDMNIDITGTLSDVSSDQVLAGRSLSAERLALAVGDERVTISGPVMFDGVPFEGSWSQSLAPGAGGKVEGEVTLSEPVAQALGLKLAPGTISGQGRAALTIDLARGATPRFALSSNLAGLGLSLPQLGWRLSQQQTGSLEVSGALGKPVQIERLALSGAGLEAEGRVQLNANGSLARLELPRLRVGGWLDSSVVLTPQGRGAPPAISLNGGRVDMRSAPFGQGGGGGGAKTGPMQIRLDSLQVSDSIALTEFAGRFGDAGGLTGDFTADLGRAEISGAVVPQNGGSAIRIRARDAGDVLSGAGVFHNVKDGTFDLTLVPVRGQGGTYDGNLVIRETRLQDAPAITGLLDAISVVGLLDELNGSGIYFTEVEARFRLSPRQVVLTRSSAVGPSMGISMNGVYNLASKQMDMQGVLSPIYILNGIGQIFARKGEGLIGFNFNLRGPAADPAVSVNPLSAFTPGIFRDIFRRPPPRVRQ
ncbi:AsmA-like C-terminal region-containing protein [Salipiger sp.]|uniref:YhdP family protein n=1 Tax=Salipiger sp. TaxID=2078585 RepID=UPI003A96E610